MKKQISVVIIAIIFFLILGFFVGRSCDEDNTTADQLAEIFEQNKKDIAEINKNIQSIKGEVGDIKKEIATLDESNKETIERFSNEISKMDDMFKNSSDTLLVNAVLRYWSNRFYTKLPGFFQSPTNHSGTTDDSKDSSSSRELLSSEPK